VFIHENQEYILFKEKRSRIYMLEQQVQKHFSKRDEERIVILPIQRCLDNRSRNIWPCAFNVLVDNRNTTIMLRGSNDIVSGKDWVRRSQEVPRNNYKGISGCRE
jgi:hypothetical protein